MPLSASVAVGLVAVVGLARLNNSWFWGIGPVGAMLAGGGVVLLALAGIYRRRLAVGFAYTFHEQAGFAAPVYAYGRAFWLWFLAHSLLWAGGSLLAGVGLLMLLGANAGGVAAFASGLAVAVYMVIGALARPQTPSLALGWFGGLANWRGGWLAQVSSVVMLRRRTQSIQQDSRLGAAHQSIIRVLDLHAATDTPADLPPQGVTAHRLLQVWGVENLNRLYASAVTFGLTWLPALLLALLLRPHLSPSPVDGLAGGGAATTQLAAITVTASANGQGTPSPEADGPNADTSTPGTPTAEGDGQGAGTGTPTPGGDGQGAGTGTPGTPTPGGDEQGAGTGTPGTPTAEGGGQGGGTGTPGTPTPEGDGQGAGTGTPGTPTPEGDGQRGGTGTPGSPTPDGDGQWAGTGTPGTPTPEGDGQGGGTGTPGTPTPEGDGQGGGTGTPGTPTPGGNGQGASMGTPQATGTGNSEGTLTPAANEAGDGNGAGRGGTEQALTQAAQGTEDGPPAPTRTLQPGEAGDAVVLDIPPLGATPAQTAAATGAATPGGRRTGVPTSLYLTPGPTPRPQAAGRPQQWLPSWILALLERVWPTKK